MQKNYTMKYMLDKEETERLKFRLLLPSDFDAWLNFFKEPNAGKYMGIDPNKSPKVNCQEWFEKNNNRYENNLGGMNALIDKHTNEFIGQCGFLVQEVDGITELEIGYSTLPHYRNKGYASEAAIKCRDYGFANGFADSIISIVHVENTKSEKVAQKNGMKVIKQTEFREMPVNIFVITLQEWNKLKQII